MDSPGSLPTVDWHGHRITRLLLGHNPMKGGSHYSRELSAEMKGWHDEDDRRRVDCLRRAAEVGIDTVQFGGAPMHSALRDFHEEGGRMQWIATMYGNDSGKLGRGEVKPVQREIDELCMMTPKPIGIQHFGERTDQMYVDGKMDEVRDNLRRIRDTGLLTGLCTHVPEVIEVAEEQDWDVDFYQTCFYTVYSAVRLGRIDRDEEQFLDQDRDRMVDLIARVEKPCIAFKVLGANRKCGSAEEVREALRYAYRRIKPTDVVLVGMWQKHRDQVGENAAMVREILADLPATA